MHVDKLIHCQRCKERLLAFLWDGGQPSLQVFRSGVHIDRAEDGSAPAAYAVCFACGAKTPFDSKLLSRTRQIGQI